MPCLLLLVSWLSMERHMRFRSFTSSKLKLHNLIYADNLLAHVVVRSGFMPSNILLRTIFERFHPVTHCCVCPYTRGWTSSLPEQMLSRPVSWPNLYTSIRLSRTRDVTLPISHTASISSYRLWLSTTSFRNYQIRLHQWSHICLLYRWKQLYNYCVFIVLCSVWHLHCKIISEICSNS